MPMVHFNITEELNDRIKKIMRLYGFGTRSEFFRFVMLWYLESQTRPANHTEKSPFDYIRDLHPDQFTRSAFESD